MYDKYSKRSRRFAFVTMKTVEDANAAAEKLNGTVSFITEFTKYIKILLMFIQQFRFLKGLANFVFLSHDSKLEGVRLK
jgi:RNA recognition motif-containing protein